MILIDNVQYTSEEVAKKFKFDLDKIKKFPEFIINETLKGWDMGSKTRRTLEQFKFPAFFYAEHGDKSIEIRYALSKSMRTHKNGERTLVYSPRKVQLDGDSTLASRLDLALFLYLHGKCLNSPFRTDISPIWTYKLLDRQAVGQEKVDKGAIMKKALDHASSVVGNELPFVAKGMGIGNVDAMTELEIQGALSELALANPTNYLKKISSQSTEFDGRILDAIDKNIFVLKPIYGSHVWFWNKGSNEGAQICDVTNESVTPQQFLVNYIKDHIQDFYTVLIDMQESESINNKAEEFLKEQKAKKAESQTKDIDLGKKDVVKPEVNFLDKDDDIETEETEVFPDEEFILPEEKLDDEDGEQEPEFPTDFKSTIAYLTHYKGSKADNVKGSKLKNAIEAGEVNPANIREWVKTNFEF